jgi:hypothetical protein
MDTVIPPPAVTPWMVVCPVVEAAPSKVKDPAVDIELALK